MSYEPEMLPDDIEHIDRRPSPIKKQKEKVIFMRLSAYIFFLHIIKNNLLESRVCMSFSCGRGVHFSLIEEFIKDVRHHF